MVTYKTEILLIKFHVYIFFLGPIDIRLNETEELILWYNSESQSSTQHGKPDITDADTAMDSTDTDSIMDTSDSDTILSTTYSDSTYLDFDEAITTALDPYTT